jgi:hypothetical protein
MDWLLGGLPPGAVRWLAGPTNVVVVNQTGHCAEGTFRRWRPTRIVVAADLVMRKRLVVPRGNGKDLRHIAELFIRSETPFALGDLFARVLTSSDGASDNPRYDLLITPTWPVDHALKALRVSRRRVTGVFLADSGQLLRLGPRKRPMERAVGLVATTLPLMIVVGVLLQVWAAELAVRQTALGQLEAATREEMGSLRQQLAERDALESLSSRLDVLRKATSSGAPARWLITALRGALPEVTEVVRVELRDGSLRLHVNTPDALGLARVVGQALPGWSARIDGSITIDPQGAETATLLVVQEDRSG